jgi:hypothetical protein
MKRQLRMHPGSPDLLNQNTSSDKARIEAGPKATPTPDATNPKEPIEATQHRSPTFPLQHSDLLAQGEHLQVDVQATAKENREGGENCANYTDHKSALTAATVPSARIWFAVQTIGLNH